MVPEAAILGLRRGVIPGRQRIVTGAALNVVVPRAAVQRVVVGSAEQNVIVTAAEQRVIAAEAIGAIDAAGAHEGVGSRGGASARVPSAAHRSILTTSGAGRAAFKPVPDRFVSVVSV
jgi:hypothetical protein